MKFIRKNKYYTGIVYEWNLPAGWSCPFALECLVKVDRSTGKFQNKSKAFRCYAAMSERFPAVRDHRWRNYDYVRGGGIPVLPSKAQHVRIHSSGDFFSQGYFDMWLEICRAHPDVKFWAFTKSVNYWVARLDHIPDNLVLTASYGGKHDSLIGEHGLKWAKVVSELSAVPDGFPVDTNDDYARVPDQSFYLLDNFK